jgi:hypothetical protein
VVVRSAQSRNEGKQKKVVRNPPAGLARMRNSASVLVGTPSTERLVKNHERQYHG